MEKERSVKILTIIALVVSILCLSVAFAAISTTIKINNEIKKIENTTWSVKFSNLQKAILYGNAKIKKEATLSLNSTSINDVDVIFSNFGDAVTYNFSVINNGSLDAKVSNIIKMIPNCTSKVLSYNDEELVCKNLKYTLIYTNTGKEVEKEDVLVSGQEEDLTFKISYIGDTLPTNEVEISNLSIVLIYVQK